MTWKVGVGSGGALPGNISLPVGLFKDLAIPTKGDRWRCLADKSLRQDALGNTFSTLVVHCTDGETTVTSSASCQIGSNESDKLSLGFMEKTAARSSLIEARCDG